MEVRRTVPVRLDVDSDDAALLEATVDTFLWSAQYVVDHAFRGEYVTTSKTQLDDFPRCRVVADTRTRLYDDVIDRA